MAYMSQEKKAELSPRIKSICKKYGIKASLAVRNHSTLVLNVKQGSIDFIGNCNDVCGNDHYQVAKGFRGITDNYMDINPYHYKSHHSGRALKFLDEVMTVMNNGNWDKSDIQTDYFNVGWYVDVNIGRWNQPYAVVK